MFELKAGFTSLVRPWRRIPPPPRNRGSPNSARCRSAEKAQEIEQGEGRAGRVCAAILRLVEADESLADVFAIPIGIPGVSGITGFDPC